MGLDISIHALREEGDDRIWREGVLKGIFLSTPSARRATAAAVVRPRGRENFYPRPPRGGRHVLAELKPRRKVFLSTPSARRATWTARPWWNWTSYFYPRPPRGGRHAGPDALLNLGKFLSTPSARRATASFTPSAPQHRHFYPRPPRGGRRRPHEHRDAHGKISIHALREEGDV